MVASGGGAYLGILLVMLLGTVWGPIASGTRRDWNWFVGILIAWFVGLGGIVGWIYVFRFKRRGAMRKNRLSMARLDCSPVCGNRKLVGIS